MSSTIPNHHQKNLLVHPFSMLFTLASSIAEKSSELSTSFNERFESAFPLASPFNKPRYQTFAKQALSSILGGISYFHGTWLVDRTTHHSYDAEDEDFWVSAHEARQTSTGADLERAAERFTSA